MLKKYILLSLLVLTLTALFFAVDVRNAASTVGGGYHDLSFNGIGGFKYPTSEVCVFCHTPHGANTNQTYTDNPMPGYESHSGSLQGKYLWNRRVPVSTSFIPYSSATFTGSAPGPMSLLCLSCHDGIGAMNVLLNYPDGGTPIPGLMDPLGGDQFGDGPDSLWGALNIGDAACTGDACGGGTSGINLQNDHPIGFVYAVVPGLKAITNVELQKRMSITGNRVECNTCHDPHKTNPAAGIHNMFLAVDNAGSALCFQCHDK